MNKILTESQWQREDRINSTVTERDVERLMSRKYQTQKLNTPEGRSLMAQLDRGLMRPIPRPFRNRHHEQEVFKTYADQQQHAFGFPFQGAGITIPAAVIWLSQAWDSSAVYPAGDGTYPVPGSFIQWRGAVYAIPGTVASTAGTPPTGGVWVIQPQAPGGNAWNVNPNPRLAKFSNPGGTFPAPPVFTDVVDSYWYPPDSQVISTNASDFYIPGPGRGYLVATFATNFPLLQANLAGTWTTVFTTIAATFQWIEIDGLTWRIQNPATSTRQTYIFYRVRQSVQ
jgi:hypothetical protein